MVHNADPEVYVKLSLRYSNVWRIRIGVDHISAPAVGQVVGEDQQHHDKEAKEAAP